MLYDCQEKDIPCDVCLSPDDYTDNQAVYCSSCSVVVHSSCEKYSLSDGIPEGDYNCPRCTQFKKATDRIKKDLKLWECSLCGELKGFMTKMPDNTWAHSYCVFWFNGGCKENFFFWKEQRRGKFNQNCNLCAKITKFPVKKCDFPTCGSHFHMNCARQHGFLKKWLLMTKVHPNNEINKFSQGKFFHIYCGKHYERAKTKPGIFRAEYMQGLKEISTSFLQKRINCRSKSEAKEKEKSTKTKSSKKRILKSIRKREEEICANQKQKARPIKPHPKIRSNPTPILNHPFPNPLQPSEPPSDVFKTQFPLNILNSRFQSMQRAFHQSVQDQLSSTFKAFLTDSCLLKSLLLNCNFATRDHLISSLTRLLCQEGTYIAPKSLYIIPKSSRLFLLFGRTEIKPDQIFPLISKNLS
ncbi:unnamed protein product [Moneuplotes crassus]|uniref:PHD-type domain-containing protein n=1 Tax=Euplotes crassus TaxID=5936 RepID=A0AAD1UEG6_EUPCR|nr:unnamed protein product [Moneuplotes crassus]